MWVVLLLGIVATSSLDLLSAHFDGGSSVELPGTLNVLALFMYMNTHTPSVGADLSSLCRATSGRRLGELSDGFS